MNKVILILLLILLTSCDRYIGVDCKNLNYDFYQEHGYKKSEVDNHCKEMMKQGIYSFSLVVHPITGKRFK